MEKKAFLFGSPIGFITSNNFIGTVHLGWGSEYAIQFRYKLNWYNSWTQYTESGGVNTFFIYSASYYFKSLAYSPSYRMQLVIYPDLYQNETNYRVAYQSSDMRGQYCSLGEYDGVNCVVGSPPSGTTAFIYTYSAGQTYFMYSPVNGNQCPLAGSSFDGLNCQYLHIEPLNPDDAFLYSNHWYMRPDIIEYYQ